MVVGFFASEYLVERFGEEKWRREYWEALRSTTADRSELLGRQPSREWATAFERVFGLTIKAFYEEFDSYRPSVR